MHKKSNLNIKIKNKILSMTISVKLNNGDLEASLRLNLKIIIQLQINLHQSIHFLILRNRNLEKLGKLHREIRKKVKKEFILKVKRKKL